MHSYFVLSRSTVLAAGATRVWITQKCKNCGCELSFLEGTAQVDDSNCLAAAFQPVAKDTGSANHAFIDF